nr:hypothetical protein [Tanacetum cinerariifolium]
MEICTKLSNSVLSLEQIKTNQAAKIKKLKQRVKKLEGKKEENSWTKEGRIAEIDADEDLSLINETTQDQGRMNDEDLFGVNDLNGDEVIVDVPAEPKKPLKKKDQIALDEEVARTLEAEMKAEIDKEERITKEKDKANIAVIEEWDDVQATTDVDRQRKYFDTKRAEDIINKPPIKAQQKSLMCTYMKNIERYNQKDFKGKRFDAIKKMFDKVYKKVNTFVAMDSEVIEGSNKTQAEVTEGSSKRAGDEIEKESAKRQSNGLSIPRVPVYGPSVQGLLDYYGYDNIEDYISDLYFPNTDKEDTIVHTGQDPIHECHSPISKAKYKPVSQKHNLNVKSPTPIKGCVLGLPNVDTCDDILKNFRMRTPRRCADKWMNVKGCVLGLANVESWDNIVKKFRMKTPERCVEKSKGKRK